MPLINLPCMHCKNQLIQCGLVINSPLGPLICCNTCKALYFVDILLQSSGKPVIVINPANLDPDAEHELIQSSVERIPLADYFPNIPKEASNLKEIISSSSTPSDLVRKLQSNG